MSSQADELGHPGGVANLSTCLFDRLAHKPLAGESTSKTDPSISSRLPCLVDAFISTFR